MTPDQPISLAVAIVGSVLCVLLPRRYALVPLALSLCLYPSTVLLPPTALSLTPQRVIGAVLLLRCILQPSIRAGFRWQLVDTAAVIYYALLVVAQLSTTLVGPALNNRAGFFLSALVPFWCVRMLITDRESLYALIRGWVWAAVPLALLGVYQMQTGQSPYFPIMQHGLLWVRPPNQPADMRLLFGRLYYRASAPFLQFIMYGWYFALLVGLSTNLYFAKRRLWPWIIGAAALPVGVIASLSGGPKGLAGLTVLILALFPWRRHWRVFATMVVGGYVLLLIFANRGPMEFVAQHGADQASSWYRVSLQRFVMNGGMRNHWVTGYGDIPGTFGMFHDLCIHWVWLLVLYGVVGVIGFYSLVGTCAWSLWKARLKAKSVQDQWLLWSLMATFLGSLAAMLIVTLFSEMYFIYHMFLAILANAGMLVGAKRVRQVDVRAEQDGREVVLRYRLEEGKGLAIVRERGAGGDGER